jgi:hypothetical protein
MAERNAERRFAEHAEAILKAHVANQEHCAGRAAWAAEHGAQVFHYEGICETCGAVITMSYCPGYDGIIDIAVEADGRTRSWIRHTDGPTEDCHFYFSPVWCES